MPRCVEFSCSHQLFVDKVQANDAGALVLVKMAVDRITNHFAQLFQRVGFGKDRVFQRTRVS